VLRKEESGTARTDESGEDSGVWSSVIADSTVEMVVVGEEFVEEDADVDTLLFCWCIGCCNDGCCNDIGPAGTLGMVGLTALVRMGCEN
jgi:hypothetical protein